MMHPNSFCVNELKELREQENWDRACRRLYSGYGPGEQCIVLWPKPVWVGLADILNQYQPLASEALQLLRELARAR